MTVSGSPPIRAGSSGSRVRALQKALNAWSEPQEAVPDTLVEDGEFGWNTLIAVYAYQNFSGLTLDGIVGPKTAASLNAFAEDSLVASVDHPNVRETLQITALGYLGHPYEWGGNGPDTFDCSGFVLKVLDELSLIPGWGDDTAAGIANRLSKVDTPQPMDLVVFDTGTRGINHIGFVLPDETKYIGANGGGKHTKGNDYHAHVNLRDWNYDPRVVSFRSIQGLIDATPSKE